MRSRLWAAAAAVCVLASACNGSAKKAASIAPEGPSPRVTTTSGNKTASSSVTTAPPPADDGKPHLAAGSDPSVLPGPILVADEGNNRLVMINPEGRVTWTFPGPKDDLGGYEFVSPDDAFFTPDGKQIIVTEGEYSMITLVDVATRKIVWRHGTPGSPGSGPGKLSNPDDAIMLPNGDVVVPDIKNCRILIFAPGGQVPLKQYGVTKACRHRPPATYGSPNGVFPLSNGHYLVTEINGDWVDEIDINGKVYNSVHPAGIHYPSDANEVSPGVWLTVDYWVPGQLIIFDSTGKTKWRYKPAGADMLRQPSIAVPLPNGDVLATDDANHRVIVVDPRTDKVVWQYGVYGESGNGPGHLYTPDGVDFAPPNSELIRHAPTMAVPGA